MPQTILFDDVFLHLSNSGISRVWREVFGVWAKSSLLSERGLELVLLNRSGQLSNLGFRSIDFPEYSFGNPAQDRLLVSQVAADIEADIFLSSYWTFVPQIPNVHLIHDLIPEVLGMRRMNRGWLERELAIRTADGLVFVSGTTAKYFETFYPEVVPSVLCTSQNGVDVGVFRRTTDEVASRFKSKSGLRDFVLTVGSRYQLDGYKNGHLLIEALTDDSWPALDVLMVGGEEISDLERSAAQQAGIRIIRLELDDSDLAAAYSAAVALIYPSSLEGFGLPVLESLACGTPVLTGPALAVQEISHGLQIPLGELTGSAIIRGLASARTAAIRDLFGEKGPQIAAEYPWYGLARDIAEACTEVMQASLGGQTTKYASELASYTSIVADLQL